jgi:hypothetical protein
VSEARDTARRWPRESAQLTFIEYGDFVPAFNAARQAAIAVFGPRWDLRPQAYVCARLPVAWVRVKVAGRRAPLSHVRSGAVPDGLPLQGRLPDDVIGERWSQAPRDQKLPIARFWPGGELPVGPEYALPGPAKLKPRTSFPSLSALARREQQHVYLQSPEQVQMMFPEVLPEPDPPKPRRPSGIGLASGYDRADADFYVEPRWIIEGLLRVERFDGDIQDPFCGGGNIVGACLQQGLTATGSDLFDRGFGEQRDAFSIGEPFDNLISNPPFARAEDVARHFLPLVRRKLVMLARLNILEGQERRELFREHPPARVWVSSRRASIPPGHLQHPRDQYGAVIPLPASGGSTAYCWICWDREHTGPTTLDWI